MEGWKLVTGVVHRADGRMFAHLWHLGCVTHSQNFGGLQPVSASAIPAKGVRVHLKGDDGAQGSSRPITAT